MTEFKCPERRTARDIARERADAAIARIEQTTTLTEDEKAFAHAHELIHVKCERNAYNEACDKAINVQLSDRAEDISCAFCARTFHVDEEPFIHGECPSDDCPSNSTDDEKYAIDLEPYEPAQPVHLPRYVKKGRDARPSRNPFADNSVRKHKR